MNTVFTKNAGQGESLLVLHGWGMNHMVWSSIRSELESSFRITWVDLPGHGRSQECTLGELDDVVERIKPLLEEPMHVLGWSLGGLIAQRLAEKYSSLVRSLTLVSTSPSFIQRKVRGQGGSQEKDKANDNWDHALSLDVLQGFIVNLKKDYRSTILRFFSLQFLGVKNGDGASDRVSNGISGGGSSSGIKDIKLTIKKLKDEMLSVLPNNIALEEGLSILKNTDLRDAQIDCPRYWILGRLDKLVPVEVAESLSVDTGGSVFIIDGAGHAPFISHPKVFVNHIRQCLGVVDSDDAGSS